MAKILIVDDEPAILNLVASYLKAEGYEVITAVDGSSALKANKVNNPDLIILDIMIPNPDGLEVLSYIRHNSNAYIILLTAKTEEIDKIVGFSIGADDYVTKPFSPRELTARVKAALRRMEDELVPDRKKNPMIFKMMSIDTDGHRVTINGKPVELTAIEFDLLLTLAENHGHVMTREKLLQSVWGYEYFGNTRVVDVHLGHIRQKLGSGLITTVRGVGYRFEDDAI